MTTPGGEERKLTMPAGTVYMGVVWDEDAWPDVKKGKFTGLLARRQGGARGDRRRRAG